MPDHGYTRRPPRVQIANLQTLEIRQAPSNPVQVSRRINVNWNTPKPFGASHSPLQYTGTENQSFPDIVFDLYTTESVSAYVIEDFVNFLASLCYSPGDSSDLAREAPPDVLITWPNYFAVTGKIESFEEMTDLFWADMSPRHRRISLSFKEIASVRITQQDIRMHGPKRGGSIA